MEQLQFAALDDADARLPRLLGQYRVADGHYDELLGTRDGAPVARPHWRGFLDTLAGLPREEIERRAAQLERQVREDGVTYNVYADSDGADRPWNLDLLPLVLGAAEWERIAQGVAQRARLADAIMGDLYGRRRLVREGLLPPALLYAHPGFLRSADQVIPAGRTHLYLVAFDLARQADGTWCVVSQRTQAPSGAGYALENRIICSRLFPEAFRDLHVRKVASFFRTLQNTLLSNAPGGAERPGIVLLTPGPYNETYFEQAYLARYLGYALAEGSDLTVRDDNVFLKTVEGLQPVHAIVRRVDDAFCDPLELRADSLLGVPGLTQAARAGNVLLANALGSAPLESPAIMGFLPAISRALLGEELELPSVTSWWCGEEAVRRKALAELDQYIVKAALPPLAFEPVFGSRLDQAGLDRWRRVIESDPGSYVLQSLVPLSTAPAWHGGGVVAHELMLRVFAVADGEGGYQVMPGGLTRIAPPGRKVVSMQRGGGSKDTWVAGDRPDLSPTLLPGRLQRKDLRRTSGNVSSRVAEHLFWMGRYAERAENTTRLARVVLARIASGGGLPEVLIEPIQLACQYNGLLLADEAWDAANPEAFTRALIRGVLDAEKGTGLACNVQQLIRAAATVRARLSTDNWRLLTRLRRRIATARGGIDDVLGLLDHCVLYLVAIGGLESDHMTRDHGWRMLSIGRYLERTLFLASSLGDLLASGTAEHPAVLEVQLELADSIITYRSRYQRSAELLPTVDLLVLDAGNPRSIAAQIGALVESARGLPATEELMPLADSAYACIAPEDDVLAEAADPARHALLRARLGALARIGAEASDRLGALFFAQTEDVDVATESL